MDRRWARARRPHRQTLGNQSNHPSPLLREREAKDESWVGGWVRTRNAREEERDVRVKNLAGCLITKWNAFWVPLEASLGSHLEALARAVDLEHKALPLPHVPWARPLQGL